MSDYSGTLSDVQDRPQPQPQKRKASAAGLDGTGIIRSVKRRASKACQCCRARKVRCNVTEHGAPCTNCRLDEVDCIVSESRRKKKWSKDDDRPADVATTIAKPSNRKIVSRNALDGLQSLATATATATSTSRKSHDSDSLYEEHVPHSIYRSHGHRLSMSFQALNRKLSVTTPSPAMFMPGQSPASADSRHALFPQRTPKPSAAVNIPYFIKPLPPRIGPDEIAYLEKKGALTVPTVGLRNQLLQSYIEFVHPYMPLLDLHDFVLIVDSGNGTLGKISLILFQAVMFAGSAFVDMRHLRNAGYLTRKEARKDFFQRTRLLYDFDYESDRVSLVQALLLLTYYYETPDDQKDTWHWMGVATSVAHTIGLHRNPERTNMDAKKTRLWKRIWWSTYMRDRLIALGMRRPTRIKTEDFDVPMLTLDDFEIAAVPDYVTSVPAECVVARDVEKQRQLAIMCIEKAKLCLCISHILSKQYCVLNNNQGMVNDRTTMMLLPKKLDPETCEVQSCDKELQTWLDELPEEAAYSEGTSGDPSIDLHKSLLHMVFFTALSALHRPQVLPSAPSASTPDADGSSSSAGSPELLDVSRRNVRRAAAAITSLAQTLDSLDLVRYLPTTGVTVLLPAIIIHLLDIKAPDEETRRASLRGFCQCMQVMGKLRDLYAAADYSTAFLEAAIRKAGIHIAAAPALVDGAGTGASGSDIGTTAAAAAAAIDAKPAHHHHHHHHHVTTVEDLVDAGRRLDHLASLSVSARTLTPPPETEIGRGGGGGGGGGGGSQQPEDVISDDEMARRLETFLASTPPQSDGTAHDDCDYDEEADEMEERADRLGKFPMFVEPGVALAAEFGEEDFESLLNMDAVGETFAEWDMDWVKTMG